MLRDVNVTVSEGGLVAGGSGTGIHVKIGASPKVATTPVSIKGTYTAKRIQQELGSCPLADACMDSVENGSSLIYCIPVAPSVAGTVGEVTKTATDETGTGTITLAGKPTNAYELVVEMIAEGALNAAGLRWSLNGGRTWSEELTVPLGGTLELAPTGLTATFVPGEAGYKVGDIFKADTTAPTLNNQDVLTAMAQLRTFTKSFEFIHVVGGSDKALWAAAATEAAALEQQYKKPLFLLFETSYPTGTAENYAAALLAPTGINSRYVQVCSHFALYTRMNGSTQVVSTAGIVAGLYASARVQQSIGEVKRFVISPAKLQKLLPEGIEEYTVDLDDSGYLTLRQYDGLPGFYINNARMMVTPESDFRYAELVRVTNKCVREVRKALLPQLQTPVNLSKLDAELAAIAEFAKTPLDDMAQEGEISSGRIIIPEGQDILTTETLNLSIRFVPVGYVREINVDLAMENPYKGGISA